MIRPKPIYEFLLWANCNNHCKFCFQQHQGQQDTFLTDEQKIQSLQAVKNFIASKDYKFGSHVLIVGGEIFGAMSDIISREFKYFLDFLVKRMIVGKIDLLYINTNLLYTDLTHLKYLLDLIDKNGLFGRLKFTTSFDVSGRFNSDQDRAQMLKNLYELTHTLYGGKLKVVTNMIMTKQLCEAILSDKKLDDLSATTVIGSIKQFMDDYNCQVNTVPYIILDESLSSSKEQIVLTLKHIDKFVPGYFKGYVDNFNLDQDKLLYEYHAGDVNKLVFCSTENAPCGHSINFNRYLPNRESCFVCDMVNAYKDYCNENK